MNQLEIQAQMVALFEELKVLEVKIQKNEDELTKALAEEATCKEGVAKVTADLKEYKGGHLVELSKYSKFVKTIDTVEKFLDQSKALRLSLECEKIALRLAKEAIQSRYDQLGKKIVNNLLMFPT